jgi:ferredoxin, 2Fe-2S
MAKIVFEEPDGTERAIDIAEGQSIMEGAVRGGIVGIDADCGGACSCATCMVYVVDADWLNRLPTKDSSEAAMLEFCPHVQENSRLTCQIKVTPELEGLRLKVPPSQQ